MLRRYPYWGWLLLSLLLWCIEGYHYHMHRQELLPERMARVVDNDLRRRNDVFDGFIKEQDVIRRMFAGTISEKELSRINNFPFYVYGYDHDSLKFWNTNLVIATANDSLLDKTVLLHNEKGVFIQKCLKPSFLGDQQRLVILFPILITYPLENDYLKSHFVASEYIPVTTKISTVASPAADTYPVILKNRGIIFYLHFNPQDIQRWVPDTFLVLLLIAALLASISWLHLMIIYFTRNTSSFKGVLITFSIIILFRGALYVFGFPFNLDTLPFFSPQLYASSKYLPSFGDLFINTLCLLWIVIFITRHTDYKTYFDKLRNSTLRTVLAIVLILALIVYVYIFVNLIRSLVLDSNISFDVSHFYAINSYTVLGLLVIGIITGISCLIIYLFSVQIKSLIISKLVKYLLIAAISILVLFATGSNTDPFYWALMGWLLLFIALLDIRNFRLVADLFEPHMIFWALFICAFSTGILQYFNNVKERNARKFFVEQKFSLQRDNLMEFTFDKTIGKIERDKQLKNFFIKPTAAGRKIINVRFDTLYLTGPIDKYQAKLYLFDAEGNGLYNKDSINYKSLLNEKDESATTNSPYLFYKESILDRHYYLSYIRIYSDTINNIVGYVMIDMDLKKQAAKAVYPELLQPTGNKANPQESEYTYAVYINDKLVTQSGDYPFTTYLKGDTLKEQHYQFYKHNDISELHYKIADRRTVVVVHYHSNLIEAITVFSYIFVIQVLLAIVILVYQLYLSYFTRPSSSEKLIRLTLRRRVHFSMLSIVLVSFIIIGSVTIMFFTGQYRSSNSDKLQSTMQVAKQSVQEYLKAVNAYETDYRFDSICRSNGFKNFITTLSNSQDINFFDNNGTLFSTSQDEIYEKGLISRMIRPDAFYQLNTMGKSIVIQNERVARLSYLSAYEPLRNEQGATLGYINVPFFSSERDLNSQISNIVVTLINLYAFIFLISSLITILITRWITRTFNVIIQQFGRLNLQRNERISWPYDDEIGLLVSEYNKMVNKVEENAARLAQSERESAWREMARQVAHEIKNPLTPMKLNIQYLQQAIRNDNPNIKELTSRVSESIIEQIDNLSYIASEFSNFAKMPEARPEELELSELLNKALELYKTEQELEIIVNTDYEELFVYSDKSQLLRVFTNLLENARQAIPETRTGIIEVSLQKEDQSAVISIKDNGEGISEEIARKIFQPYFTTKTSGTGLGLAMTRKIIEFWKGEIWFDTKEGEGTVFYIRLPLSIVKNS